MNEPSQDDSFGGLPPAEHSSLSNPVGASSGLEQGIRTLFSELDLRLHEKQFPKVSRRGRKSEEEKNQEYLKSSAEYVLKLENVVRASYPCIAEHLQKKDGKVLAMEPGAPIASGGTSLLSGTSPPSQMSTSATQDGSIGTAPLFGARVTRPLKAGE
ncbi:hypothetical protein QFC20_007632 [Naganishia adeliensis]|uniref:Uncharacterized protein n=1 Tax=Naganishia adeliensis TaxID=92952 RepID=A0ACC2UYL4_9TREE|nr:hypothetical protein QFC20_007632 [Naganishia adeliensis]